jgi:hypothetical protein
MMPLEKENLAAREMATPPVIMTPATKRKTRNAGIHCAGSRTRTDSLYAEQDKIDRAAGTNIFRAGQAPFH